MSFIKERIKEIAINKGIPLGVFFKKLDLAPSGFNGEKIKKGTNSDTIEKIVSLFPDINLRWLITGEGEMILSSDKKASLVSELSTESIQYQFNVINEKLAEFDKLKQTLGSLITTEVQNQLQTSKKNVIDKHKKISED